VHALLAGDWLSTGGVLNITAAAWTAGFHWWRSGNVTRTQNKNVSEYMLVLALCLVMVALCNRADQLYFHPVSFFFFLLLSFFFFLA